MTRPVGSTTDLGAARAEGREYFRVIADALPQLVWSAEPDGTIDFFNERWIAYTGLSVEGMRVEGVKGVVHPDELQLTWDRWRRALDTGEPYEIEYRLRSVADGEYRWFLARAFPVRDDDGTITSWVGSATDIDEQKRTRDSLAVVLEAVDAFAGALDEREIMSKLAELSVRQFADWCCVLEHHAGDTFETVAVAHRHATRLDDVERFRAAHPTRKRPAAVIAALKSGPSLVPVVTDEMIVAGAADDAHLAIMRSLDMRSVMVLPLKGPDGELYGAVTMVSAELRRKFNSTDLAVAERVVSRASAALHRAREARAERELSARLRFVNKASASIFESLDVDQTFDRLLEHIVSDIADFAVIVMLEQGALRCVAAAHRDAPRAQRAWGVKGQRWLDAEEEQSLIDRLAEHQPFLASGEELASFTPLGPGYLGTGLAAFDLRSAIVAPLYARDVTYGALLAYSSAGSPPFGRRDEPLFVEVAHRMSLVIEMSRSLDRERRIAATMQQAALPAVLPHLPGMRFQSVYSPASDEGAVGGDWYDALALEDGSIMVSVGDVEGRGVHAAAIMGKMRHVIGTLPLYERDPAKILDAVDWIVRHRHANALVTAFVGIIAPDRRTIRYANAGHPYPILRKGCELIELRARGLPVGMRTMAPAEDSVTLDIEGADLLLLFTDGLIEWGHDWRAGEERLREILSSDALLHAGSPAQLVHDYCVRAGTPDDVAILAVSFVDKESWTFEADDARAAHDARAAFVRYLQTRLSDAAVVASAEMVFGELVANVARHAPGPISVEVEWQGENAVVHVIDRGPPFELVSSLPDSPLSENGRGLYIVSRAGRMSVERLNGFGNHVTVTL